MLTTTNLKDPFFRLSSAFLALFFTLFIANLHAQCPSTNLIENPDDFIWTYHPVTASNPEAYYGGVMEVGETTLTLNNGETFTTRAYRQEGTSYSVPGPTITVVPGNKYILSLHNTLPFEVLSTSHNVFRDPNAVNIHTHGLHISGESPGDDVTRVFEGGRGGDFVWDIPADHMGGTYWYHAHHHGATYLQVAGGMLGMLIVDDANDGIPANVAGMEERELLFAKLDPTAAGTGGDILMGGSLSGATWTTNGVVGGNICMPANTWQHWRVLIADPNAMLRDIEFGPECEVMVLARDGVWRTVAPKDLTTNTLKLTGASRADFAIRTTGNSWVKVGGNIMANIYVGGPSDPSVHPFDTNGVSTWSAIRPTYLRDLRAETNVNSESVKMGARTVNGSKFDHMAPNFTLPTTMVQEWKLSGNVRHPFHLHIYHVQALADDRDFEAGEFYDVVASQMFVRFDLNQSTTTPYAGKTIMHCHILEHEDQGAMGWMDVQGGAGAPTFPADANLATPYSEYYIIGGVAVTIPAAPTALSAAAVSSSSLDLNWVDNASDEDGFNIERSIDGTSFTIIGSVGVDVTAYNDNGLNASTTYYYRASAFNVAGSSSYSNTANATTLVSAVTVPAAPTALSAAAVSSSSLDLNWVDNASDEDGFNIERSIDGTSFTIIGSVGVDVTAYNDNGLNASTTYYYRASAFNVAGSSSYSNTANATTLVSAVTVPAAPTALSAAAVSSSSLDLNWVDNASDEDGFNIERSIDGISFTIIGSVGVDVTAYNDNGLNASTTYYYRVSAFNVAGSSTASNVASAATLSSGGSAVMHVESLTVAREGLNGNRYRGVAAVSIYDAFGLPVSGATVSGDFSGTTSSSVSEITDANGEITVNSGGKKNPTGEWCFTVNDVVKSGVTYDSTFNLVTEACESGPVRSMIGDSNNQPPSGAIKSALEAGLTVYPNPLRDGTRIEFNLIESSNIEIEVYSIQGKRVDVITDGEYEAGLHFINWNTHKLGNGTYVLLLRADGKRIDTQKLIIMR